VVFDDDSAGEAADLVCLKEEVDHVRLALVHCKFSGGQTALACKLLIAVWRYVTQGEVPEGAVLKA
jgi:hypothetical protein